jgi:hypothetical protein
MAEGWVRPLRLQESPDVPVCATCAAPARCVEALAEDATRLGARDEPFIAVGDPFPGVVRGQRGPRAGLVNRCDDGIGEGHHVAPETEVDVIRESRRIEEATVEDAGLREREEARARRVLRRRVRTDLAVFGLELLVLGVGRDLEPAGDARPRFERLRDGGIRTRAGECATVDGADDALRERPEVRVALELGPSHGTLRQVFLQSCLEARVEVGGDASGGFELAALVRHPHCLAVGDGSCAWAGGASIRDILHGVTGRAVASRGVATVRRRSVASAVRAAFAG